MFALLLKWKLTSPHLLGKFRRYVTDESWKNYQSKTALVRKFWLSRPDEFAAFYLWETEDAREEEVQKMHRVKEITGTEASIDRWELEASQEGVHAGVDFNRAGRAWKSS